MDRKNFISTIEFCEVHNIEVSFIESLEETGLIEITRIEENDFIPVDELMQLERMVRLHNELNINVEGIDTIYNLLNRITALQDELTTLKNKLRFFERDLLDED